MGEAYEWRAIGGHVALDLANTVSWRLDASRRIDRIGTPGALVEWAAAVGVLDRRQARSVRRAVTAAPDVGRAALDDVVRLRTALSDVLDAQLDRRAPRPGSVSEVRVAWERALPTAEVEVSTPMRWMIVPDTSQALSHLLGMAVGELLRDAEVRAVGRCDGPGCGWLFLDTTRNHSRRWCDTGDCGNRARGQRHRAKVAQRRI